MDEICPREGEAVAVSGGAGKAGAGLYNGCALALSSSCHARPLAETLRASRWQGEHHRVCSHTCYIGIRRDTCYIETSEEHMASCLRSRDVGYALIRRKRHTFETAQERVPQGHGAVVEGVFGAALALQPGSQRAKAFLKP